MSIAFPCLIALLVVVSIYPTILKLSVKIGFLDQPNERKLQKQPVPLLGGLAVFCGMMIATTITIILFRDNFVLFKNWWIYYVAVTTILVTGLLDDAVGLSPIARIAIEVFSILIISIGMGAMISNFQGILTIGTLPNLIALVLSIVSGVGIINAMNMIDGVNGLSGSLTLFFSICFVILFYYVGNTLGVLIAMSVIGAIIPFLVHNIFGKKTQMYLGDAGTMVIGLILTFFIFAITSSSSLVNTKYPDLSTIAFSLSVLSVPVIDTLRVIVGRLLKSRSPLYPDKTHLHHLFINKGFSHLGTTICIIIIAIVNFSFWLISYFSGLSVNWQFFIVLITNSFTILLVVYSLRTRKSSFSIIKSLSESKSIEKTKLFLKIRNLIDSV